MTAPSHPPLDPSLLASEAEGIRRLARAILADEDRADDATQETLRLALERGPRPGFAPAAWLRGVLRNVIRRSRRSEARRAAHERAARAQVRAPAAASTERLEVRRAVLEAVLVLPEALRTAIELRFFEGLPPRAMAPRLGIPVETCRSRVRRGLEALRVELDRREGGGDRRFALLLAPLAASSGGFPVSAGLGALLMTTQAKLAVGAAVVLLFVGGAFWLFRERIELGGNGGGAPAAAPAPETTGTLAGAPRPSPAPLGEAGPAIALGTLGIRVTGLVIDLAGAPIVGARIHAGSADRLDDLTRPPDATSDAAGRFAVERAGSEFAWRIQASAPGRRTASVTASAGAERDVVLRLARAIPLWLVVRDVETDAPIAGAEVVMIAADEGSRRVERMRTDAEGLASLEDPGIRPVAFEAAMMVRVTATGFAPASFHLDQHLLPGRTSRPRPHRVGLQATAFLAARVVAADGAPVAGASVFGWDSGYAGTIAVGTTLHEVEGGALALGPVESDGQGRASVGPVAGAWVLFASRGDAVARSSGHGTPTAGVELRLAPAVSVEGTVVDEAGVPVPDADVELDWDGWFRSSPAERLPVQPAEVRARFRVRTGADGRFALSGLPSPPAPKAITLQARAEGPRFGSVSVAPANGTTQTGLRIVLGKPGETWPFRVQSASGAAIVGALVRVANLYPAARAGADGLARLAVADLPPEQRFVAVEAPTFAARRVPLPTERPTEPIDVVLEPEAVLDLTVRGADGKPVPGAQVTIRRDEPGQDVAAGRGVHEDLASLGWFLADAEGRVLVEGLPRTPVRVVAEAEDEGLPPVAEADRNRREVRLALPGPVEIVLPRVVFDPAGGSVVEGEVLGDDGTPISGRYSAALQSRSLGNFPAVSTGRRFRFEGIPAGRWQLQIYTDSQVPMLADVETQAGRDVTGLRVARSAPGKIVGRLVAEPGTDLAGLPVQAIDTRGLAHVRGRATTGPGGTFRFEALPPGPLRLALGAPGAGRPPFLEVDAVPVEVVAGQEAPVDLRVVPAARLILVCEDPRLRARPSEWTQDEFRSEDHQTNLVLTWPDGHMDTAFGLYRGRNETPWVLAPGRYQLRVRRFEEFTGEVVVARTGEIEVVILFGTGR